MKKQILIIIFISQLFLISCSIQQRRYLPGFYVERLFGKEETKASFTRGNKEQVRVPVNDDSSNISTPVSNNPQSEELIASINLAKKSPARNLFSRNNEKRSLSQEKGKAKINEYSLLRILRKLAEQGKFIEYERMFVLTGSAGKFSANELHMLRILHDVMLEHGLAFKRNRLVQIRENSLEVLIYSDKRSVLQKIGTATRILLFESMREKEEFEKSMRVPDELNVRIGLAIANGKVVPLCANHSELDSILP